MIKFNIPDSAKFVNLEFTFAHFFGYVVDRVPEFSKSISLTRRGIKLLDAIQIAIEKATPFESDDDEAFSYIVKTIKSDDFTLPVLQIAMNGEVTNEIFPSRLFLPFCDAIENAMPVTEDKNNNDESTGSNPC